MGTCTTLFGVLMQILRDLPEYLLFVPSSTYSGPYLFEDDEGRPVVQLRGLRERKIGFGALLVDILVLNGNNY
jgi:hypothetical protein